MTTEQLRAKIAELRAATEANQLVTYCAYVSRQKVDNEAPSGQGLGYDMAVELPIEKLRELFEEDDWGSAWELMDSEALGYWEQDAGTIETIDTILGWLDS